MVKAALTTYPPPLTDTSEKSPTPIFWRHIQIRLVLDKIWVITESAKIKKWGQIIHCKSNSVYETAAGTANEAKTKASLQNTINVFKN